MMKIILKTICLSLMFGNFMFADFAELKRYLGGNPDSDFFVIAITRESKNILRPAEIELIQLLLSLLLKEQVSEEYTAQVNTIFSNEEVITFDQENVPNYLKTLDIYRKRIEKATEVQDKDKKAFIDILNDMGKEKEKEKNMLLFSEVSKNPGIIVFNEYFFGQTPFPHSIAEWYTTDFSNINSYYLFACNFLTYSPSTFTFTEDIIKEQIKQFNETKASTIKLETPLGMVFQNLTESTVTLNESNKLFMLENKTFYAKENGIISTYNKSSYYKEEDSFLDAKQAFYYFGNKKDNPVGTEGVIAKNISTEICRDVSLGLRKGDIQPVNLHLIQSNTLNNLISCKDNLPSAWCYIFCDPSVSKRSIEERKRDGFSHIYFNSVDKQNMCSPCYSYSFMLHDTKYDINIYKIDIK